MCGIGCEDDEGVKVASGGWATNGSGEERGGGEVVLHERALHHVLLASHGSQQAGGEALARVRLWVGGDSGR